MKSRLNTSGSCENREGGIETCRANDLVCGVDLVGVIRDHVVSLAIEIGCRPCAHVTGVHRSVYSRY